MIEAGTGADVVHGGIGIDEIDVQDGEPNDVACGDAGWERGYDLILSNPGDVVVYEGPCP